MSRHSDLVSTDLIARDHIEFLTTIPKYLSSRLLLETDVPDECWLAECSSEYWKYQLAFRVSQRQERRVGATKTAKEQDYKIWEEV